jgi:aspartate-semialdehyde dehydrogenase
MKVAVVGATGLVGGVVFQVLKEHKFPITELYPVASARSAGKKINYEGTDYSVIGLEEAVKLRPDIAIFSAGGATSELTRQDLIIANPNCSTIQMVLALAPLHKAFGIKRLVISTYQSFTGTGVPAVNQYEAEKRGEDTSGTDRPYHYPIFENCIPHCDVFLANDYTKEEMKLVYETRKILGDDSIAITATAVRVPVNGGHSESINVEFHKPFEVGKVRELLAATPGIIVQDDLINNVYPMPLLAKHKDEVFVGRIRRDESIENGLNLWVVADNLRKGAATNAVQIAEYLMKHKLIGKPVEAQ